MSLLTIITNVCDQLAQPRPATVIGNNLQQVRTLLALSNLEGKESAARYNWTALQTEATHTTLAAEDQGAIATIASGFRYFINGTQWNRTQQRRIPNITPVQWQQEKSSNITGPYQEFRVRAGRLLMIPAPPAGQTVAFEYISNNWVSKTAGTAAAWVADSDTSLLDENIHELGLRWRFLQQKGMSYGEEFKTYERMIVNAMGRDGDKPVLSAAPQEYRPLVSVPDGSWPL